MNDSSQYFLWGGGGGARRLHGQWSVTSAALTFPSSEQMPTCSPLSSRLIWLIFTELWGHTISRHPFLEAANICGGSRKINLVPPSELQKWWKVKERCELYTGNCHSLGQQISCRQLLNITEHFWDSTTLDKMLILTLQRQNVSKRGFQCTHNFKLLSYISLDVQQKDFSEMCT